MVLTYTWSSQQHYTLQRPTTLDNKFQIFFCVCDEYVINLFVCIYEFRKGTWKNHLALVLKLFYTMLFYEIGWNIIRNSGLNKKLNTIH